MPRPSETSSNKSRAIDRLVGRQLRKRRLELGLSQQRLADAIGVTFQQIQKYEHGSNRVVASRLFDLAKVLHVTVEYFFADPEREAASGTQADEPLATSGYPSPGETRKLVDAYYAIADPALRKRLIDLVRSVAAGES
jgi:transcriptional regulator with XRE-family HTH domain